MSIADMETGPEENGDNMMLQHARQLLANLERGNSMEALKVIHDLNKYRDQQLFAEVGRLTRSLHDSIVNFHNDTNFSAADKEELSRIRDASDRLSYVIQMTEKSANKTMDMIEQTLPMVDNLGEKARELKPQWERLMRKEMKPEEFRDLYKKIDHFLKGTSEESGKLHDMFSSILLAQDYQDLTGQIIKRVITLVQEVEESLVRLVKMAAQIDAMAGLSYEAAPRERTEREKLEGPVVAHAVPKDAVSGQDEVDDLLSSLGF